MGKSLFTFNSVHNPGFYEAEAIVNSTNKLSETHMFVEVCRVCSIMHTHCKRSRDHKPRKVDACTVKKG